MGVEFRGCEGVCSCDRVYVSIVGMCVSVSECIFGVYMCESVMNVCGICVCVCMEYICVVYVSVWHVYV